MMRALGVRFLDADGQELPFGGAALGNLAKIDKSDFIEIDDVEFVVAGDVDNPLLGTHGAAAVYGPQKGASPDEVRLLDAALARLAAVAAHTHGLVGAAEHDGVVRSMGVAGQPGAGAAGGVGFAALAFLAAEFRPGIDYLLDLLGFQDSLEGRASSSPVRARSTSRRCAARHPRGSRAPRPRRGSPSSWSAGAALSVTRS